MEYWTNRSLIWSVLDSDPMIPKVGNFCKGRRFPSAFVWFFILISLPILAHAGPVVSGFSPANGRAGTELVINGSGFGALPENNTVTIGGDVFFGGTLCRVVEASPLQLKVILPGNTRTGRVRVKTLAGGGESASTFIAAPVVNNLSPGRALPGATVQIRGLNFSPSTAGNQVTFNGVAATVTVANTSQLTTTVPAGGSTGQVVVVNGAVSGGSDWPFEVISTSLRIDGFFPGTGVVGSQVTLRGKYFNANASANQISLNGLPASITAASPTSLTFIIPNGATSGPISITVAGQTRTTTNDFQVAQSGSTLVADGATLIAATSSPGQYADLNFTAVAGDKLGLGLSSLVRNPITSAGNPYVAVLRPDNVVLQSVYCVESCVLDLPSIPVSGTYTVRLFPNAPSSNLSALVALTRAFTTSITPAAPINLKLGRVGQIARLEFAGVAGQFKTIELFTSGDLGYARLDRTEVRRANGSLVNSEGTAVSCTGCSSLTLLNLPDTGLYTLIVTKVDDHCEELTIRLVEPTPVVVDGLALSDETTFPYRTRLFSFPAISGQRLDLGVIVPISADFVASTFRPNKVRISIFDSLGNVVHEMSRCESITGSFSPYSYFEAGCGIMVTNVAVTGEYTVVVRPFNNFPIEPTRFVAYVSTPSTLTATIDDPGITLNLNRPGQAGVVTFDGNAGQDLQFNGGSAYNGSIYFPFIGYKPDGSEWIRFPAANSAGLIDLPVLPVTGTYVLEEGGLTRKIVDRQMSLPLTIKTLQSCNARAGAISTSISLADVVPNQVVLDSSFVVSANVTPSNGACGDAQGTVKLSVQGVGNFCTYSTPAESSCSLSATQSGVKTLILAFTPTDPTMFAASYANVGNAVTVLRKSVSVEIVDVSPAPSDIGQMFTTTVQIVPTPSGTPSPSGYVFVRDDIGRSCYFYLPNAGCTMSATVSGVRSITASYYGDSIYAPTNSSTVAHAVLPRPPTITGFTPASGLSGSNVTITGTDFNPLVANDAVAFNGTSAVVSSATATSLVAIVPNGATTGPIRVTVLGKSGSSATNFVVTSPPLTTIVSGFVPMIGVPRIPVTISGSGFNANNVSANLVKFNGTPALVLQAGATALVAIVPDGATTGPISVSVAGQIGISAYSFTVVPPGAQVANVAIVSISAEPSIAGQFFTIQMAVTPTSPTGPTPTGAVTVSDGVLGCMTILPTTTCTTMQAEAGEATLYAWYTGDQNYASAYSPYFLHITNPVTPTEICGFDPRTVPNDPVGFVPIGQLSGVVYSAGLARNIVGNGTMSVTIDSPIGGSTTPSGIVDVVGMFNGPVNTGITINGIAAKTVNGKFMVPNVSLSPGTNTLEAVATTLPGLTATASISLTRSGTEPPIAFHAEQPVGIARTAITFNVALAESLSGANLQRIRIDTNGDGIFDQTSTSLEQLPRRYGYNIPGLFKATLEVTTITGQIHTATQWVLIRSAAAERGMLCDIYGYLKKRLSLQDAAGAGAAYDASVRSRYVAAFTAIGENLPSVAMQLGTVASGFIGPRYAQILVLRDNADQTRSGYHIQMIQNADGVWRIESM